MSSFTFVELFAGIGGFRVGLEVVGGKSLYANERDKYAALTYSAWFGEDQLSVADVRSLDLASEIPDHDVLTAGFPCQPFSIAGVSKKASMGRPHGFQDLDQGNLFFVVLDAIAAKRPKVILLENVSNLIGHDKGNTWRVIRESLEIVDYEVQYRVINAASWVPQKRRRVYIVGFDRRQVPSSSQSSFRFPNDSGKYKILSSILETTPPDRKYMLTDNLWAYLQDYSRKHREKGNGFGFRLFRPEDTAGTLSARYYKDGAEILIHQEGWRNPRRLTPQEASRLMGFSGVLARKIGMRRVFPQVVSDMQAYKQYGNSVCPLVVREIGQGLASVLSQSPAT